MPDLPSELTSILTANFDVPDAEISPGRSLNDLGIDSVATVELADLLQQQYRITIDDEELSTNNTVEQLIGLVAAKTDGT
ncbi:acyl carrier protein [Haloechinothrix sp. LS1_15]|uniref:acyl carrier protein n=1 Tax=Haloechinothrix sp. LS1_15 TaxID=2652248 RepID=UPI0029454E71|nr:acyl carrier protein [Haloechinothrix sp. LS1_15]MDV6011958.1 acyl carrier protein [Haloechinothrix sp. LS1_15]